MITLQFKQRLLMGSLGFIAVCLCIYYSHEAFLKPVFYLANSCVICFALVEYYQLTEYKGFQPLTSFAVGCSIAYLISLYFRLHHPHLTGLPSLVLLGSFLLFFLLYFNHRSSPLGNLAVTVFGIIYLTIPLSCALRINYFFPAGATEDGRLWLAYVLIISKSTDIGAYFFGKTIGKNKLAPLISPKKTIEGAIGGVITALAVSFILSLFFHSTEVSASLKLTIGGSLLLSFVICILAQLGDLTESLLKRDAGVKDSSHLPGFGGVLDLVDSLVFTLPFMYLLLEMRWIG